MIDTFIRVSYIKIEALGKEIIRALCINLSDENRAALLNKKRCLYTSLEYIIQTGIKNNIISDEHDTDYYIKKIMLTFIGLENYWVLTDQQEGLPDLAADSIHSLFKGLANI